MEDVEVKPGLVIPARELWFTSSRSGGPGGQHVNTTNSRVTLHWNVDESGVLSPFRRGKIREKLNNRINDEGVLTFSVSESRSQHRNREIALERLAELVRGALVVQRARRPTKPSKGAKRRRLETKKKRSTVKKNRGKVDLG